MTVVHPVSFESNDVVTTPEENTVEAPAGPTFGQLGLPQQLVTALERRGIHRPFAIQTSALPDALAGRDVLGKAATGSGKTLAFGLPLLARIGADAKQGRRAPRGLVLVPTRELAQQVHDALAPLGQTMGVQLATVYGGAPMYRQIQQLRRGVDVIIATPGRLQDLISQGEATLAEVVVTVLDEADFMADLGFLPVVKELLDQTDRNAQRLLFSATLDGEVDTLQNLEPALGSHPGALLHPMDGAVDNVALMDALERAVERVPTIKRIAAEILSVDSDQPSALTRTRGRIFGARLVLATGAWAAGIPGLPRPLPVRPVRGQLLRLAQCPVHHVTYGGGGYLVPRGDTILVGATSEEAGFENETSLAGLATLRNIAARAVPALGAAIVVDHWAGLRPMSIDGHPILGPDPDSPALVYACGFSRNGILFAPWAAARLADLLVGDVADGIEPFRVDRPSLLGSAA